MSKFYIELNGVANVTMLMDQLTNNARNEDEVLVPAAQIYQELDILERYMLAVADAARAGINPPFWHEIKANKNSYPNMKERRV